MYTVDGDTSVSMVILDASVFKQIIEKIKSFYTNWVSLINKSLGKTFSIFLTTTDKTKKENT